MTECEFPEGCDNQGEPRTMTLNLVEIKPGEETPLAEYVKATLCDEHHALVQYAPVHYFPDRVTTTP